MATTSTLFRWAVSIAPRFSIQPKTSNSSGGLISKIGRWPGQEKKHLFQAG